MGNSLCKVFVMTGTTWLFMGSLVVTVGSVNATLESCAVQEYILL